MVVMGHEQIATWLSVPPEPWPPDHYTLLGLPRGEGDSARIERHVHDCLEKVRRFQLAHPEQATEAMNRIAQAFVCLMDTRTKQGYDAAMAGSGPTEGDPRASHPADTATLAGKRSGESKNGSTSANLDWREVPPPVRPANPVIAAQESRHDSAPTLQDAATVETTAIREPAAEPREEESGLPAVRFATKRALLDHTLLVRKLLAAWRGAGRYLRSATRPLSRPSEATDLIQLMGRIRGLVAFLPELLGQAGQPGYLVAALARQPLIVPTVQTLLPSQRSALTRDWENGHHQLVAYLARLRVELRASRKRSKIGRGIRATMHLLEDRPGLILIVLGLIALNRIPAFQEWWAQQAVILLGILAFHAYLWWDSRETARRLRLDRKHTRVNRRKAPARRQVP